MSRRLSQFHEEGLREIEDRFPCLGYGSHREIRVPLMIEPKRVAALRRRDILRGYDFPMGNDIPEASSLLMSWYARYGNCMPPFLPAQSGRLTPVAMDGTAGLGRCGLWKFNPPERPADSCLVG
jgi:hypothetical protein